MDEIIILENFMQEPTAMMPNSMNTAPEAASPLPMTSNNPITDAMNKAQEITGVGDAVNKVRGGMPQTQAALGMLGAGMPYSY